MAVSFASSHEVLAVSQSPFGGALSSLHGRLGPVSPPNVGEALGLLRGCTSAAGRSPPPTRGAESRWWEQGSRVVYGGRNTDHGVLWVVSICLKEASLRLERSSFGDGVWL